VELNVPFVLSSQLCVAAFVIRQHSLCFEVASIFNDCRCAALGSTERPRDCRVWPAEEAARLGRPF
jgi:hypothetical protein